MLRMGYMMTLHPFQNCLGTLVSGIKCVDCWLEVRHGRSQDHNRQIHVEHVNKESDKGGT
jgi:hypothetical protein